ncbi:hypothetical protein LCGC14_2329920 [marine sediment metagenome]|uniref:Uncharacterized protein n=1 Tax=marine sediment metagenome TaxID=412755 RepID=A0A0F9ESV1_9ZZZZ
MSYPDYTCPYTGHKKECSKLRDRCPKWLHFIGTDPNTGQPVDTFDCADRWIVRMQMDIVKEVRQGAAATESFRNVILELNKGTPAEVIEERAIARIARDGS